MRMEEKGGEMGIIYEYHSRLFFFFFFFVKAKFRSIYPIALAFLFFYFILVCVCMFICVNMFTFFCVYMRVLCFRYMNETEKLYCNKCMHVNE